MIWLVFILLVAIPADKLANHLVLLFLLKLKKKTKESRAKQEVSKILKGVIRKQHEMSIGYWIYCIMTLPLSIIIIPLVIVGGFLINSVEEIIGD